jgi:hypothetical protein
MDFPSKKYRKPAHPVLNAHRFCTEKRVLVVGPASGART